MPSTPGDWVTLVAAILSTAAITQLWRPLGSWVGRRLDINREGHASDLSTCRKEVKVLRGEFKEYQDRADGIILALSIELATMKTRLSEREDDVAELRLQIKRPRALRHDPILPPEPPA